MNIITEIKPVCSIQVHLVWRGEEREGDRVQQGRLLPPRAHDGAGLP